MQAAQGFGKRGVAREPQAAQAAGTPPTPIGTIDDSFDDAGLSAFQTAARADWAQARIDRPSMPIWKRHPGMTALAVMTVVFALITLAPLHMSVSALRWIRGGLSVSSIFGFGAKRLFRKKSGG